MAKLLSSGAFAHDASGKKIFLQCGDTVPALQEGELERLIALGVVEPDKTAAKKSPSASAE
jgi:hypothetical protein